MYDQIREDPLFTIFFSIVTAMAAIASCYLLLRRGNAIAPGVTPPLRLRLWAAAIMLENVISHVCWLWYFGHPSVQAYILVSTQDILLLIPVIAGFLLSMLQDRRRPV